MKSGGRGAQRPLSAPSVLPLPFLRPALPPGGSCQPASSTWALTPKSGPSFLRPQPRGAAAP